MTLTLEEMAAFHQVVAAALWEGKDDETRLLPALDAVYRTYVTVQNYRTPEVEYLRALGQEYKLPAWEDDVPRKLALSITNPSLSFSKRTRDALPYIGVEYVFQLVQISEESYLKSRNLGRKSLNETKEILRDELGFTLGMKLDPELVETVSRQVYGLAP